VKPNASKPKAMSYNRMEGKEKACWHGRMKPTPDLTGEMARREGRLKKIAEAKAALEREAQE